MQLKTREDKKVSGTISSRADAGAMIQDMSFPMEDARQAETLFNAAAGEKLMAEPWLENQMFRARGRSEKAKRPGEHSVTYLSAPCYLSRYWQETLPHFRYESVYHRH